MTSSARPIPVVCPNCRAKVLPVDETCRACGEVLPGHDEEDAPDAALGRTIAGKYEIKELIGEGAMGRVYEARQTALDKLVAIKLLHKHLANDPKVAKRFHREARAASRLSHPSSMHILDFGQDEDGTLYIAMELLDGDDLLAVIEDEAPLTPLRIYAILKQVLSALDAAHHAGIIHRDLKPENVVVAQSSDGHEHVKVCDFGIAKIQEAEGGSMITVSGFVCGTPEYMAPEQARGEILDKRADIYAAGCMLYQMMTAKLPFTAESALGIITKHLTEKPMPPRERRPEWKIPASMQAVCLKAMAKEPDDRYQDAPSMSEALREAVDALGEHADEPLGSFEVVGDEPVSATDDTVAVQASSVRPPPGGDTVYWTVGLIALGALAVAVAVWNASEPDAAATVPETHGAAPEFEPREEEEPPEMGAPDMAVEPSMQEALVVVEETPTATEVETAPDRPRMRRQPTEARGSGIDPTAMTVEPRSPGRAAYEEGRRLFLANDIPGAIRAFELAARHTPESPDVQKQLGRAYMRAGNVDRAAAAYRRYLELAPNAPDRAIIERLIENAN
jgi:serine/threonine-protein kinase